VAPEPIPIQPLIKTETTNEGGEQSHATVQTIPWSPVELAKLQGKYSRRPEESKMEYFGNIWVWVFFVVVFNRNIVTFSI